MKFYDPFPDKILISDYEVSACHGVNPEEKKIPQRFLVSMELCENAREAAAFDDLNKTASYSAVCKIIRSVVTENCFDLIETLAERLCREVLLHFGAVKRVKTTVKKPDAPMKGVFAYVGVEIERGWHTAYLSLGSNMDDRKDNLDFAVSALKSDENIRFIRESGRIATQPYGGVADGEFLNSAAEIETIYDPFALLSRLNEIEALGGRVRRERWGNRTLDIDMLFYDDLVIASKTLSVPHPDMANRAFVLGPLAELCQFFVHPVLNKRVDEMLLELTTEKK